MQHWQFPFEWRNNTKTTCPHSARTLTMHYTSTHSSSIMFNSPEQLLWILRIVQYCTSRHYLTKMNHFQSFCRKKSRLQLTYCFFRIHTQWIIDICTFTTVIFSAIQSAFVFHLFNELYHRLHNIQQQWASQVTQRDKTPSYNSLIGTCGSSLRCFHHWYFCCYHTSPYFAIAYQ